MRLTKSTPTTRVQVSSRAAPSNFDSPSKIEVLKMITDSRSEKIAHLKTNPACEMVWWFGKSSEQYRISGFVRIVGNPNNGYPESTDELLALRKQQWGNLSDSAREQFYWKHPGKDFEGVAEVPKGGRETSADSETKGSVLPPPDEFLLLLLVPARVKYLRLTDNYAQVDDMSTNGWIPRRVNP